MNRKNKAQKDEDKPRKKGNVLRAMGLITSLGMSMTVCVLIGVFAGRYLDGILGTSPWMLLIFSLLGAFSSIKLLYDTVNRL